MYQSLKKQQISRKNRYALAASLLYSSIVSYDIYLKIVYPSLLPHEARGNVNIDSCTPGTINFGSFQKAQRKIRRFPRTRYRNWRTPNILRMAAETAAAHNICREYCGPWSVRILKSRWILNTCGTQSTRYSKTRSYQCTLPFCCDALLWR